MPLRVKTGSMPLTLHGAPRASGHWAIDIDSATELRMTQHESGEVLAHLEATHRDLGCRQPRLPA